MTSALGSASNDASGDVKQMTVVDVLARLVCFCALGLVATLLVLAVINHA